MSTLQHRILDGKYRLVRQLEQGGMGSVWFAEHLSLHSPVAVKLIAKEVAESEEGLQRFLREARTAASIRSPHVVQILDYGVDGGTPFIVMELLDGESLADRLERVGRLTPAETERILRQVGRAVSRAHDAGIVHRDLKPANIFIINNDDEEVVKLLDFGIAKAASDNFGTSIASNTRTGAFLGTPFYVSPEQAEGIKSIDHRTDIWSMGVIAFECLVGHPPFRGDTFGSLVLSICSRPVPVPSQLAPVPPGFDAWFASACARDIDARFPSAREASNELRAALEGSASTSAAAASPAPRRSPQPPPKPEPPTVAGPAGVRAAPASAAPLGASAFNPSSSDLGITTAAASSAAVTERSSPPGRTRTLVLGVAIAALASAGVFVARRSNTSGVLGSTEGQPADTAPSAAGAPAAPPAALLAPAPAVPPARPESPAPSSDKPPAPTPIVAPVIQPSEPVAAAAGTTPAPVARPSEPRGEARPRRDAARASRLAQEKPAAAAPSSPTAAPPAPASAAVDAPRPAIDGARAEPSPAISPGRPAPAAATPPGRDAKPAPKRNIDLGI